MMCDMIYSDALAGKMQVNTTSSLTASNITVVSGEGGDYTLTLVRGNLPQYTDLKLIDTKARQIVPFDGDSLVYSFSCDATGADGARFKMMNTAETSFDNLSSGITEVLGTFTGSAVVYNLSGKAVAHVSLPQDMEKLKSQLASGVYIISVTSGSKTVNHKIVIGN